MSNNDSKNLVLLIGTNPLPNYIVAYYFIDKNPNLRTIWLLHSEDTHCQSGTRDYAESLKRLIEKKFPSKIGKITIVLDNLHIKDVGKSSSVQEAVKKGILDKLQYGDSVHLNYTGGTKAMVTHTYVVFEQNKKGLHMSYSYLDSRKHQIRMDDGNNPEKDLREIVKMGFDELIELHGFRRKNEDGNDKEIFKEAVDRFSQMMEKGTIDNFYNSESGYNRKFFMTEKGEPAKKYSKLTDDNKKRLSELEPNEELKTINDSMPEDYRLFINGKFIEGMENEKFKRALRFLDGFWLEHYVSDVLEEEFDILSNWVINKEGWGENNFELDVILMSGYQLTGISCTTSDEKYLCKTKGFEIILRTRQIGGDEAKAVLITRMGEEKASNLEKELMLDTGTGKSNIKVLGKNDLKKEILQSKIKDFLRLEED